MLFPIKDARNAETYRIIDADEVTEFHEDFQSGSLGIVRYDENGQLHELALLKDIHHPGIPELKRTGTMALEVGEVPYGIFELYRETLMDLRRRKLVLNPEHVQQWVIDCAVAYLHEKTESLSQSDRLDQCHAGFEEGDIGGPCSSIWACPSTTGHCGSSEAIE